MEARALAVAVDEVHPDGTAAQNRERDDERDAGVHADVDAVVDVDTLLSISEHH